MDDGMQEPVLDVIEDIEQVDESEQVDEPDVVDDSDEDINLEDIFDDEQDTYMIGSYDLSKYKDVFDFSNEEDMRVLSQYAEKYHNAGFTQEQIEFILDEKINEDDEQPKKITKADIKARLNSLSREEKRNYRAVNSFVSGILKDTELAGRELDIMQNPALVKLMNIVYKQAMGSTQTTRTTQKTKEKQLRSMSLDDAYNKLLESTRDSSIDKEKLISELKAQVSDRAGLDNLLSIIQ